MGSKFVLDESFYTRNNVPTKFKRGSSCIKVDGKWTIDNEMPILTKDSSYVESRTILNK